MDKGAKDYLRFLSGDDEGFTEIIKDYKDGLILYLSGILRDIYLSEELAEETFFKIVIKKPKFRGNSSFKTWLYAIGRNTAIDFLRRGKGICKVNLDENLSDEADLEEIYIREEKKIIIHRAMSKLKSEYRQVLWLIYFEGFTSGEVSTVMKKSVHSVETLVYRARKALKNELLKEGFVYEDL